MSAKSVIFRAGIIPYMITGDVIKYMFMKPSDSTYGGPDWQIAKGHIEKDDPDSMSAAVREGMEELGLRESNISSIQELGSFLGRTNIFLCEVKDMNDFGDYHFETGGVIWLSAQQFHTMGRSLHRHIVDAAEKLLRTTISN